MCNMSSDLLALLLERKVEINDFKEWISGKNIENIGSRISRSGFSLYVLNFIQQQTSSLFPLSSSDKQVDSEWKNEPPTVHNKVPLSTSESIQDNEKDSIQKITSTEGLLPGSPLTNHCKQTPTLNTNQYIRTASQNAGSFHNKHNYPNFSNKTYDSSFSTTNRISPSKSGLTFGHFMANVTHKTPVTMNPPSKNKGHRAVRSHLFYESSESSVEGFQLSPESPIYDQTFPDLSSGNRVNCRQGRQHSNSNINSPNHIIHLPTDSNKNFNSNSSPESCNAPRSPKKYNPFKEQQRLNPRQNRKKRVNPTRVKDVLEECGTEDMKTKTNSFGTAIRALPSGSSPFQESTAVEPRTNYNEERLILKQKRSEPLISVGNNLQTVILPNAPVFSVISADPKKVTYYDYIVCLADIYCVLLDFNFVPNVTSEIHFIFSLLTVQVRSKVSEENNRNDTKQAEKQFIHKRNEMLKKSIVLLEKKESGDQKTVSEINNSLLTSSNEVLKPNQMIKSSSETCYRNILNNIHNCVWFAVVVITKQLHIIKQLDRITLKLLADSDRLNLYASGFASDLNQLYQKKDILIKTATVSHFTAEVTSATVKFQLDTDNRDNFTSPNTFSNFRKQRDIFYDILHNWRTKHNEPKPDRILQLLALSNDPVNMTHLARLVCCQLISDIVNKTDQNSESPGDRLLSGVTKDKLSMLETRLKNPQGRDQSSPRPPSQFPDNQLFYKVFLDVASENSYFREHIVDCFVTRILELDDTAFELDESESRQDEINEEFKHTVMLSCLLAKFLGLVVFSPYKRQSNLPEHIVEAQISVRQKVQPPLDLVVCLRKSLRRRSLIQTVPWTVEYLGMMDCVSPFLSCYRPVLESLIEIYRSVSPYYFCKLNTSISVDTKDEKVKNTRQMSCSSALLLRLCLGWLFDSSFFPESVFFSIIGASIDIQNEEERKCSIDTSELIDEKFIFECCPYFLQIKLLLMANVSVKGGSVRHITPVPAQINLPSKSVGITSLELQLEDNFLSGQIGSLRSTLDFVKERVASACIKHICSNVIAKAKQETVKKINSSHLIRDTKKKDVIRFSITELKVEIDSTIAGFCEPRIRSALEALLGAELLDPIIISISLKIATRRCKEKIVDWLNSHINLEDIFTKLAGHPDCVEGERMSDVTETKNQNKEVVDCINRNESKTLIYQYNKSEFPVDIIINLRDFICDIIEREIPNLNEEKVIKVIQRVRRIAPIHCSQLATMSVDLVIILAAYQPQLISEVILSEFGELWNRIELIQQGTKNPLQYLLCPRNILLFCQWNPAATWAALSRFIVYVLKNGFLTLHQMEVQCVAIFRHTWPPAIFKLISNCLKLTLEKVKQENVCGNNTEVMLMLDLVSETSRDIEEGLCSES